MKYWYQAYGVRHLRVQPQVAAAGRLAELGAVGRGHQRDRQRVHRRAFLLTDESHPGDDVAPLIRAADLQPAAVPPVQLHVVVGLQQHVAELGVGDALALEPAPDGVSVQHDVDRKVLADVAQEFDRAQLGRPGQVVLDNRAGGRIVEVDEPLQLPADAFGPVGDGVGGVESALAGVARVADHAGRSPGQHDRPVPGPLEPPHPQQRDQVCRRAGSARSGRIPNRR